MSTAPVSLIVFASSTFGLHVLEALMADTSGKVRVTGIVSMPDAPQGRGQKLEPNIVTLFARKHSIPVVSPAGLRKTAGQDEVRALGGELFLVAGYGKIIPRDIIDLSKPATINIHPSLLPKYRGPSPIQSMLLADETEPGITIMQIDEEMDHGPIVIAEQWQPSQWPLPSREAEKAFAHKGVDLFLSIVEGWMNGAIKPSEQEHNQATYTRKFEKSDAEIRPDMSERQKYLTFCAFQEHPGPYFFDGEVRIKVVDAEFIDERFTPTMVVPAGKKPMTYAAYLNGKKGRDHKVGER